MKTTATITLLALGASGTPIWHDGPYGGPTPVSVVLNHNDTNANSNNTLQARTNYKPDTIWHDPVGPISKGYFSVMAHSGHVDFFSEFGSDWGVYGERIDPCGLPDVTPYAVAGWKQLIKADPNIKLHHPFWYHPGNQCGGAHSKGEQLDNSWIWYGPALLPNTNHINIITDPRCQSIGFHTASDWPIDLAFRCVLPMYDKGEGPHDF